MFCVIHTSGSPAECLCDTWQNPDGHHVILVTSSRGTSLAFLGAIRGVEVSVLCGWQADAEAPRRLGGEGSDHRG